ncbi:MAG: hypothetical protein M3491_06465, partial [Actinomycetota bacterium]|nr:hypothetical protein [Actinomycetota bacterium]
ISWSAANAAAAIRGTSITTIATTIVNLRISLPSPILDGDSRPSYLHRHQNTNNAFHDHATPNWINSRKIDPNS